MDTILACRFLVVTTSNPLYPTARYVALGFDSTEAVALFLVRRDVAQYTVYKGGAVVDGLGGAAREMVRGW